MKIFHGAEDSRIRLKFDEKLIIDQLLGPGVKTRIGLSEALNVSPAWITKTIKPMMASNLVEEYGKAEKSGGRRARVLGISRDVGLILGLDLGVDSLKIGLSEPNVNELSFKEVTFASDLYRNNGNQTLIDNVISFLQESEFQLDEVRGIGICFSEAVDNFGEMGSSIRSHANWDDAFLWEKLLEHFPNSMILGDRDVNMMAYGEGTYGNGQDVENFIFLKIGNSISAGIVCQNQLYRGASGYAGDIGHMVVEEDGPACHCGKHGCLVAVASGHAIASQAQQLAVSGQSPSLAARLDRTGSKLNAIDVGEAAAEGDQAALELVDRSGEYVGTVLTKLVQFYNPDSVFIGGGVSKIGHRILTSIHRVVLKEANPMATRNLRIEYSQLGERAGVLGAIKMTQGALFTESSD